MGWNRSATILSSIVFLAFGFQVVGVFSDPVSRNKLPIGSVGRFDYGVLGYCPKDTSKDCSKYGIGYQFQDDTSSSWSQSTQKTLSSIFVVHIVAAGLLLISFFLSVGTHYRNPRFWTAVEIFLAISFIASALSFAVEIALFKTDLKFAGWFTLASTILSLISVIALGVMQKSLHASLGQTKESNAFDPILFQNGNEFVVGRDEKQPVVTSHFTGSNKGPNALRNSFISPKGYAKIPDNKSSASLGAQSNNSGKIQSRAHPLPLPMTGSTDSIGAVSRSQQQNNASNAWHPNGPSSTNNGYNRNPNAPSYPGYRGATGPNGSSGNSNIPSTGANAGSSAAYNKSGVATGAGAGAGAGAAAGAAAGYGAAAATATRGRTTGRNEPSSSRRQDPWTQQMNQRSRQQQQQLQNAQQNPLPASPGLKAHGSTASIASSHVPVTVPAGAYFHGAEQSERYGPNVVQIPKLRQGANVTGESASVEYHKDETQSRSPIPQNKVPNFSRFSAQEKGATSSPMRANKPAVNPMLERYVQSSDMSTDPKEAKEPFYDAPMSRIPTQSPESEASHYTSVSERQQQQDQATKGTTAPLNLNQQSQQQSQQQQQPQQQQTPALNSAQNSAAYQGNYAYSPNYQNYAYQQGQYSGYQGYNQGYPQGYAGYQGYQPSYQPAYAPNYNYQNNYAGMGYGYGSAPQPRAQERPVQQPSRSEMALQSNPDFGIGEMGRKKRPNRR